MSEDIQVALKEGTTVTVKQDRWTIVSVVVAVIAALLSGLALAITVVSNSAVGKVQPIQPSGYAVIRGNDNGYYAADRLVVPLEWSNTTGSWILIRRPQLVLQETGGTDGESGKRFFLVGEYKDLSPETLSGLPEYRSSLALEPHSITTNVLVFNVEEFWSANSDFRFESDRDYHVLVKYLQTPKPRTLSALGADGETVESDPLFEERKLDIVSAVDELSAGESSYYSINELDEKV